MRVLYVRPRFAFKIQGSVPPEVNVFDSAGEEIIKNHRTDPYLTGYFLFVRELRIFFINDIQCLFAGTIQNFIQIYHMAFARRKGLSLKADHSKRYVN